MKNSLLPTLACDRCRTPIVHSRTRVEGGEVMVLATSEPHVCAYGVTVCNTCADAIGIVIDLRYAMVDRLEVSLN